MRGVLYDPRTRWPAGFALPRQETFLVCPGTDLEGAPLVGVDLERANLADAKLSGTQWEYWNEDGLCRWASSLVEVNLEEADLSAANLRGVNLERSNLRRADLQNAHLWGASLMRANLLQANLRNADLTGANLNGANLRNTDLRGAKLCGDAVRHENFGVVEFLGSTNLSDVNLQGARYDRHTRWPKGFDPVKAGAVKVR